MSKIFFCSGKAANHLLTEPNAPLGNFSSRIETCFALGLIDDFEYEEITLIRKIRNGFAHSTHGFSFKDERVKGLCSSLRSDLPEGSGYPLSDARFRFINSVICIVLRLYYRDAWVGKERRKPKTWVEPDQSRWYSVDEKRPPVNILVVAMVKRVKKY